MMRIIDDVKLDFKDVLFLPKRSTLASRQQVDLTRRYTFKHSRHSWSGIPIMAANMDGVGTVSMAKALYEQKLFTTLVKSLSNETIHNLLQDVDPQFFAVSTGTGEKDWLRLQSILQENPTIRFICIDVANGYSEHFGNFVEKVRQQYPHHTIIAGNVVTADMTQELILRGADIIKVGIGPGSVCTTRKQTGVGFPQLSAIIECADAAHGLGGHIIADGGCTNPGDVAKAFGAGADFVMLGGMLAGHDEGEGRVIEEHYITSHLNPATNKPTIEVKQFIEFYGMSSATAMEKHHGGVAEYRSSEGKTVRIPYKGPIRATLLDILGGLRSTCTYVGAPTLKQLSKCTTFVRVTQQINNIFS
ncbi:GMP reductase [Entomospira nematocerorum]|nr:GMP reductase [Entomospira nematocera]WDI34171.1 GMP reductase [Entomospira nematocera]